MSERLKEIRERLEKATEGPWETFDRGAWGGQGVGIAIGENPSDWPKFGEVTDEPHISNAKFCAHAREDIPYLLAELETANATLSRAECTVKDFQRLFETVSAERDSLTEHKRILFEENGRLLAEKESGMWDTNHPVWKERDRLRAALAHAKKVIDYHASCADKHLAEIERIECGKE